MDFMKVLKGLLAAMAGGATMSVAQYASQPGAHLDSKQMLPMAASGAALAVVAYFMQSPNQPPK